MKHERQGPNKEFKSKIEESNKEGKRGKRAISGLRLPWLSMTPHREPLAQISRNLGNFWSHGSFLGKKQGFSPCALRHWRNAKVI